MSSSRDFIKLKHYKYHPVTDGDLRDSRSRSPLESKLGSSPSPPDHASRLSASPRTPPPHPLRSSSPPPHPLPFPPPHTGGLVRPIASGPVNGL